MITLPTVLQRIMDSNDLNGLKPFAVIFRNKWVDPEESGSESGESTGGYVLDTLHPIDISSMIAKPNTLSMTLDVNEIAQYNANNVTLTLSDPENRFLEGTPNSYFPEGYQLYGSRVVLYYGVDSTNKTSLFTGVIKDLPTHKPETYQVELKLVSPLEMLKDIEAKDFSDKVTGETLTYVEDDSDGHKVYKTSGTGVGGFDAVYGNGTKLFEGVDYEASQTSALGLPAIVTIINQDIYSDTITADYYTWKTGLTVEQIVAGLVALAGYDSTNTEIRSVVWNTAVRSEAIIDRYATVGYLKTGTSYTRKDNFNGGSFTNKGYRYLRHTNFPDLSKINIDVRLTNSFSGGASGDVQRRVYFIGELNADNTEKNGIAFVLRGPLRASEYVDYGDYNVYAYQVTEGTYGNGTTIASGRVYDFSTLIARFSISIERSGTSVIVTGPQGTVTYTISNSFDFGNNNEWNEFFVTNWMWAYFDEFKISFLDDTQLSVKNSGVMLGATANVADWQQITGEFSGSAQYSMYANFYENGAWGEPMQTSLGSTFGITADKITFAISITSGTPDITYLRAYYLGTSLIMALVNLSGKTVLEALQDFALISGYEFGVNREGVFFFRPRVQSTTPIYTLGNSEIAKVDTVKKNLSDFFTKLTLTFATVPLEFYANTGTRPTPIDRYGVINKEIDKPEIVNYDNPELAQAIGPQLLEVYSAMPNVIQATGKLNLALELGDIVSLRRNYPLTADPAASDYNKYTRQDTYYRACKITGMNYNFAKRQITYTLRDVSNSNNSPLASADMYEFVYDLPIRLGVK